MAMRSWKIRAAQTQFSFLFYLFSPMLANGLIFRFLGPHFRRVIASRFCKGNSNLHHGSGGSVIARLEPKHSHAKVPWRSWRILANTDATYKDLADTYMVCKYSHPSSPTKQKPSTFTPEKHWKRHSTECVAIEVRNSGALTGHRLRQKVPQQEETDSDGQRPS